MKRKINVQFISLTVVAVLITVIFSTLVDYALLKREIVGDLQVYAETMKEMGSFENVKEISSAGKDRGLRITLIDNRGNVQYDTEADISKMDNHTDREEISEAFRKGAGQAVRHSETIGKSTIYYAILMDNGNVLRVAKDTRSIEGILFSALPYMLFIILVVVAVSVVLTRLLTRSIIRPIDEMAQQINSQDLKSVYKELRPFVSTIQKQHEDILRTAQMRQEFTANVTHELKTPLTAISGYAELIENGMASEQDVARFSGEIHRNANRLLILINDIIRLSELDASSLEITFEMLDLHQLAGHCVELLKVNADRHRVRLVLEGNSSRINCNPEMINELMYNLCDNAIRYNNEGGSVSMTTGVDEKGDAFFEVQDTGIGIPKDSQDRIFERFYRVDKSRSKSTGGTGLGLAIVKHIVVQLHAVLELESEPGIGTRIRVTFPEK